MSSKAGQSKTVAKLDAFYGRNGEHHVTDTAFDRIEKGIAEARRKAGDHAFDDAADGIEVVFRSHDSFLHLRRLFLIEDGKGFPF